MMASGMLVHTTDKPSRCPTRLIGSHQPTDTPVHVHSRYLV